VAAVTAREALAQLLSDVDGARDELAELLADLVRFPTVNYGDGHPGRDGVPNGNETPCALFLRDRLRAEGIPAEVHESAPARGNLIARLGRADVDLVPALCAGFTDSRFLRPLGVAVYDFMPLHPGAEARDTGVHGTNERIEVEGLVARARFLMAAACLHLGLAG
jgi:acetylornithine deacetylase/succinyl-diaminopimelate desuccinylase-like protein